MIEGLVLFTIAIVAFALQFLVRWLSGGRRSQRRPSFIDEDTWEAMHESGRLKDW